MGKLIDLTGRVFDRLTVLRRNGSNNQNGAKWECLCICGNKKTVNSSTLKQGTTKSCGCFAREKSIERFTTHGMSRRARQYGCWDSMKVRCTNPNNNAYKYYGGRGIKVCDRWLNSFENFWEDMKEGYRDDLTLDRIDNDGNYEPRNCKWSTRLEQIHNRRPINNNKVGARGICLTPKGKYVAQIHRNNKRYYLGCFGKLEDAIKARNEKQRILEGVLL